MLHHRHAGLGRRRPRRDRVRRLALRLVLAITAGLLLLVAAQAAALWWSWRSVERTAFDEAAFAALPPVGATAIDLPVVEGDGGPAIDPLTTRSERMGWSGTPVEPPAASAGPDIDQATDPFDAYLIVGSDEGDTRADVIMLALLPTDGAAPLLVSLPRDLYLPNRCTGGLTRLNANYNGCGADVNGPTQLAGAVTDFTGIEIDHFALFTMDGFERIIDAVGGMEICVDNPVREDTRLDLPAGCSRVDGRMALGWVRSRMTEELVDGRWRVMPQVNDLTRNQRQQELLLTVLARVGEFDSPGDLSGFAASLGDAFTLDDRLGLADAAELAWRHRDLSADAIVRLQIPVRSHVTAGGAQVLLPTEPFAATLAAGLTAG
ncbi:MAG: LCP family protein [Actinomycetota bacterium]